MNQGRDCRAILLPVDLVGRVLSFVDQKHRILTCSLVSRTWNQAVKAATRTLSCRLRVSVEDQHLSNWLSSNTYVSQIESMHVDSVASHCRQGPSTLPVLQLPLHKLAKLQALKLRLCRLQPASMAEAASYTDGHAAPLVSLAGLTALTQLRFDHCIAEVRNLSSCTALQHLEICFPLTPGSQETTADGVPTSAEAMLAAALPQLQHLTHLSLRSSSLSRPAHLQFPAFSSVLSNLQQLQSLQLGPYVRITTASLAHLPVSLSSLYIDSTHGYDTMLAPEATPQLRQLTCLSRLQIDHLYNFNPALLSSYPSLTWLMLKELAFEDRESVSVLLSALQKMSQLRHLDLHDSIQKAVREPELYAALTASRYLTYLDIGQCCLSVRAAQAIFKPDYPCQGLQSLIICAHQVRAAANMELLVRCCPALEYLEITNYNAHTGRIDQEVRRRICAYMTAFLRPSHCVCCAVPCASKHVGLLGMRCSACCHLTQNHQHVRPTMSAEWHCCLSTWQS